MSHPLEPIRWSPRGLVILDQTLLPTRVLYRTLLTAREAWWAIRTLQVRGAPVIGLAAAFGMYLGLRKSKARSFLVFLNETRRTADDLASSRPTAVNLRWAVDRMVRLVERCGETDVSRIKKLILQEALGMVEEDNRVCLSMGQHGMKLLKNGSCVLTHCNAGALVTAHHGTALAPIYAARKKGMKVSVYADETRPLLQGARLTAFELQKSGVPVTVICDNMAATVMAQGKVDLVIVGADRVTANGDFANKIGTYGVAILAREHGIPFYCAAPLSSFDMNLRNGKGIPIEERSSREITHGFGRQTVPSGVAVYNPAFDVTPHRYVTAFITEKGVIRPPFQKNLSRLFEK